MVELTPDWTWLVQYAGSLIASFNSETVFGARSLLMSVIDPCADPTYGFACSVMQPLAPMPPWFTRPAGTPAPVSGLVAEPVVAPTNAVSLALSRYGCPPIVIRRMPCPPVD